MNRSLGTTIATFSIVVLSLPGCVMGIPDYYPTPKPAEPCKVIITDGSNSACLTERQFLEWRKRNGL